MASIRDIRNAWRDSLVIASFRGAQFHVETSGRKSGRRTVVHQYPKRNVPYTEDMGRDAVKWNFSAYLIHGDRGIPGNVVSQVDNLISALEEDDAGLLVHPMIGTMMVLCDSYGYSNSRTKGGFFEFDLQFVEAGSPAMVPQSDTGANLSESATTAENNAATSMASGSSGLTSTGAPAGII